MHGCVTRSAHVHVCLDTARGALRQYRSVLPNQAVRRRPHRLPVDIRRFPWIKPPGGRLRLRLRARWRSSSPATRATRRRGATPSRARSGTRGSATPSPTSSPAQQRRRGAPPERARRRRAAARPADGRRRHRPAGRALRRPALHPAEGAHRHPAGRAGARASTACRPSRCSGSTPRITTGTRCKACGVLDADARARAPWRSATRRARTASPVARVRARRLGRRARSPTLAGDAAGHRVHARSSSTTLRARLRAGRRHGGRVRPVARVAARSAGAGRLRLVGSRRPSRSSPTSSRGRSSTPGDTSRLAADGGRGARGARAITRRSRRTTGSLALFHLNGGREPIRARRRHGSSSATRVEPQAAARRACSTAPARVQPQRPAAAARAGHAVSHRLLRRRTERAGLSRPARAASTTRSACRCR